MHPALQGLPDLQNQSGIPASPYPVAAYRNSHNVNHVVNNVGTASQLSDNSRNTEVATATDQDRATYTAQMATVDRQLARIESAETGRGGQRDTQGDSD